MHLMLNICQVRLTSHKTEFVNLYLPKVFKLLNYFYDEKILNFPDLPKYSQRPEKLILYMNKEKDKYIITKSLCCCRKNFEFLFGTLIDSTVVVSSHIFTQ